MQHGRTQSNDLGSNNERRLRFAIVGAGISGMLAAIKLKEAGYEDIVVFEKAGRIGGTWRDNVYPGIGCDVPSHLYSYSFAPNPDWSRLYAPGAEIQAYLEAVAQRYQLQRYIRFNQGVVRCEFTESRWQITTASGERETADVLVAATGVTHQPYIPVLAGLDSFGGASFHSSQWRRDVNVTGRIGVIGTGSSAVQIVSALAEQVDRLVLFQRTAQWILPQENRQYQAEERQQFAAQPELMRKVRAGLERRFVENFSDAVVDAHSPQLQAVEQMCREYLEREIADPVLRERLRPNYRVACKRLVVCGDFYRAIQRSNAQLVTASIHQVEPSGVRTQDGVLHELDVLVLATGFRTDQFVRPTVVVGRGGLTLAQAWAPRPRAYLCTTVPDFPNFFLLNGPNGPVGNFPLIEVAELQMGYALQLIELLRAGRCREISPLLSATQEFENARIAATKNTVWTTGCRSWYMDDQGVPAVWPWTIKRFRDANAKPDLAAFELR
jgi:cation diffusion facilitator CzcD-associated flavoprotein CzcO